MGASAVTKILSGLAVFVVGLALLSACGTSVTTAKYYVSLGDSYAVGYQPLPHPHATSGYTAVVAKAGGLELENFGCAGATTTSVLHSVGCVSPAASDAVSYPSQTQAAAATGFIERHKGAISLITVSIGGNDVLGCATASNLLGCALPALATVKVNVETLVAELRRAAGADVPILGLTYPDVFLGTWVYPPGKPDTALAALSVDAFRQLFNPTLQQAYTEAGGHFLDITADTDAYTSLSSKVTLSPYGRIPLAVARVCNLTWYCSQGNIHANTSGYDFIGKQIVATYELLHH